jgi:hypothetical protein
MNKPKLSKLKDLKMPVLPVHHVKKLRHPIKHIKGLKTNVTSAAVVPFITNDTLAEHREQVLKGARKYIYPLQHSKHRIVVVSTSIFISAAVVLLAYGAFALYKLQSTSTFVYRITQVVPFPVASVHGNMASYESYLFELRHFIHYYETQQKLSFQTVEGKQQLASYKDRALQRVTDDAYIKELARQNKISVTNSEVDAQIVILRNQNRLGTSDQVFEDVLRDFWGWSLNDFKRSLREQLLARKVVSKLDTDAHKQVNLALDELGSGVSFADVAKKYSADTATKDSGGDFPAAIDKSNRNIDARVTSAIFGLKPSAYSKAVDTGYTLEIVKLNSLEGDKAKASHIQINFKDINTYLKPLKDKYKPKPYIKV